MTDLTLPDSIAAYFAADKQTPDDLARCFMPQAVVKDEGHTHTGLDAIKAWREEAAAKYAYTSEPFAMEQMNGYYVVSSHVVGNFPGSPVDLRYRFRLERERIALLEINT